MRTIRRQLSWSVGIAIALGMLLCTRYALAQGKCQFYDECRFCPSSLTNDCASQGGSWSGSSVPCGPLELSCRALCNRLSGAVCEAAAGPCDAPDTCNSSGACIVRHLADGTPCGSDAADECDRPDMCAGGSCSANHEPAGTACSAGSCTNGGTCAIPIHFLGQGRVRFVTSEWADRFSLGERLTLEYAFDPLAPDLLPETPDGLYLALTSAVATIGDEVIIWPGYVGRIEAVTQPEPRYEVRAEGLSVDGRSALVQLWAFDAISTDLLPIVPVPLPATGDRGILVGETNPADQVVEASLDSLEVDHCPYYSSANNTDSDANGIGDECECGDQNGDGRVNAADLVAINLAISAAVPTSPLCDTNLDDLCDVADIDGAGGKIFGSPALCSRYPPPPGP